MKKAACTYWHKFLHLDDNSKMLSCHWSCTIRTGIKPKLQTILVDIATVHSFIQLCLLTMKQEKKEFFTSPSFSDIYYENGHLSNICAFVKLQWKLFCKIYLFYELVFHIIIQFLNRLRCCLWLWYIFFAAGSPNISKHTYLMKPFTNVLAIVYGF